MILMKFATEIKGDSTVEGHADWITLDSIQLGVGRSISSSGGSIDRETSNPSFSEVSISKSMDKASTELLIQATCGKSLGKCEIHFIQTGGGDVKDQVYLKYELSECIVSSYSVSSGGERPTEGISLSFTQIKTQYTRFKDGKAAESGDEKGWDLQKNQTL